MGNCCPLGRFHRRSSAINVKNVTLLLVGLDNAGKTTVAKVLSQESLDGVVPTVGFSRVSLKEKSCHVTIYDLGGGLQIRDIWPRYYADVHGVIFVIDASDIERMNECRKVLEGVLMDSYITGKPVLLLANKQDKEGALDEIDIVDILNVERLVNQQKCPTLVELCSARQFSRKMDAGIANGYKWLLRCVAKDYPMLNNRVLKDIATQEELERIKRVQREERINRNRQERDKGDADIQSLPGEKYQNGVVQMIDNASVPGQIEDITNIPISRRSSKASKDARETYFSYSATSSCEFFKYEKDSLDMMLIQSMDDNREAKNFLVRPKSSGPRLSTSRPDTSKKKATRRISYQKHNKTAPSPVTDVILEPIGPLPKIFTQVKTSAQSGVKYEENTEVKSTSTGLACGEKITVLEKEYSSTPGSRRASATSEKRCMSGDQARTPKSGNLFPLKIDTDYIGKELILDVTSLDY